MRRQARAARLMLNHVVLLIRGLSQSAAGAVDLGDRASLVGSYCVIDNNGDLIFLFSTR